MSPRVVQIVGAACFAGLVSAAATRIPAIDAGRRGLNMMGAASPREGVPPEYAFAIQAFGAFRGLITDIAFIRAEQYKEQGRYYDAMQLAKWICHLQPHFPSVWEFCAWNMSWNISVTTYTAEERWNWVYNGVKLLRDQGIPYNPRAVNLYKQLAWTFNNKMGEVVDDFHYAYKCNWAWRMHLVLGLPPQPLPKISPTALAEETRPEMEADILLRAARQTFIQNEEKRKQEARERGEEYQERDPNTYLNFEQVGTLRESAELARRAAEEFLRAIDESPKRLEDLYVKYPEARALVAKLRGLGIELTDEKLSEDHYWREDGLAFAFFAPYRRLTDPTSTLAAVTDWRGADDPELARAEQIDQILEVRKGTPAGAAVVRWLQKKVLGEVYRMETSHMLEVVRTFGAVDWRSVDAASLYWVTKGLIESGETISHFRNDKVNTARIMLHSLRNLFLRGQIVFEPFPPKIHLSYLNLSRDINLIEPMHEAYVKYGPLFDPRPGEPGSAGNTYRVGHANHLTDAIRLLYLSGREADAARYFRYLQEAYGKNEEGTPNPAFAKTLREFVKDSYLESISGVMSQRDLRIAVDGLLANALSELAAGNAAQYARVVKRARELHAEFMKDKTDRASLPKAVVDFDDWQADFVFNWLDQPALTPLQTLHKVRLWRGLPLYLRQAVYDDLLENLRAECQAWDFDVAKAFPEPKGMAEYREQHPRRHRTEQEAEVETLPRKLIE